MITRPDAEDVAEARYQLRLVESGGEIFEPDQRIYRDPLAHEIAAARARWWQLHIDRQVRPLPFPQ